MDDVEERVRKLIDGSARSVRNIAHQCGLDYLQLWRWYARRTSVLRANDAEAIENFLKREGAGA